MASKKNSSNKYSSKKASKGKAAIVADSPVTVGGGGGTLKASLPMVIRFVPGDWVYDGVAGTLTLANGNCKRVKVTTSDIEIKVPLTGVVTVELKIVKP